MEEKTVLWAISNLRPMTRKLWPSPLNATIAPLLFKESLFSEGIVKKNPK